MSWTCRNRINPMILSRFGVIPPKQIWDRHVKAAMGTVSVVTEVWTRCFGSPEAELTLSIRVEIGAPNPWGS